MAHTTPFGGPGVPLGAAPEAVAAAGSVSVALDAPPGTVTALRIAVCGLVLIVTIVLAARVMMALERARRRALNTGSQT